MIELGLFLFLLVLGYVVGSSLERRHYASIEQREAALAHQATLPMEVDDGIPRDSLGLVTGSAVISVDYFKRILAGLRLLFGGQVTAYESLIDRARREAVLRMKEARPEAELFMNVRIETSAIGAQLSGGGGIACLEVCAYGTAMRTRGP